MECFDHVAQSAIDAQLPRSNDFFVSLFVCCCWFCCCCFSIQCCFSSRDLIDGLGFTWFGPHSLLISPSFSWLSKCPVRHWCAVATSPLGLPFFGCRLEPILLWFPFRFDTWPPARRRRRPGVASVNGGDRLLFPACRLCGRAVIVATGGDTADVSRLLDWFLLLDSALAPPPQKKQERPMNGRLWLIAFDWSSRRRLLVFPIGRVSFVCFFFGFLFNGKENAIVCLFLFLRKRWADRCWYVCHRMPFFRFVFPLFFYCVCVCVCVCVSLIDRRIDFYCRVDSTPPPSFYRLFRRLYRNCRRVPSFTNFYLVLPSFTLFYLVLLSFT